MEMDKILPMKEGVGHDSYARNSGIQKDAIIKGKLILEASVKEVYQALNPQCFMMADFGCSSGHNSLLMVSQVIDKIDDVCTSLNQKPPQVQILLNDLPGNDFNTLFKLLTNFYKKLEEEKGKDFGPCSVSVTPKSFYGRVYPDEFLHFVHSANSLHWLSQVPKVLNNGHIYIAETSPPEVQKSYSEQFRKDFSLFLRSRARELVTGGQMVLMFPIDNVLSDNFSCGLEVLGSTIQSMVLEGLIEEEKLDSFNLPLYAPGIEEVMQVIDDEGSIILNKLESFTIDSRTMPHLGDQADILSGTLKAGFAPLFASVFSLKEATVDDLFVRYKQRLKELAANQKFCGCHVALVVSLTKR